jgi:hypothetical protein
MSATTISVVALMTIIAPSAVVETATSCTVKALEPGVTSQSCPASDVPSTRGDVRVYRGRSMGGELRSADVQVCTGLYRQVSLLYGAADSVMSAMWDMGSNIKVAWRYDGSICTLSSSMVNMDPKSLIDFILDTDTKEGPK